VAWRSQAALAHLALGEVGKARRLAAEEVQLARRFGAPGAIGVALRALGLVALAGGDRGGLDLLSEAAAVLERSGARLEHARVLAELGAAVRRANRRSEARGRLRAALELAEECGARALAARAREELRAAGGHPPRPPKAGHDSLTPSERRVAELAIEGLGNRAIAQALFVTVKTVEMHLSNTYSKLGISSRAKLAAALAPELGLARREQGRT
jgi:DNA-binding NarL/FixJ family response regulator